MNTIIQLYRLLTWHLFTEVKCAWCKPHSVIRRAWLWPRRTTHGMCARCFARTVTQSFQAAKSAQN